MSSPQSVFVMIGKSEIRTQTTTRAWKSYPNQTAISGTIAMIGVTCTITAYG